MIRIAQCCQQESWPAQIACVISNRPDAPGLVSASELGIPTRVVDHKGFASRAAFDAELAIQIEALHADLVVLAGFMRILGEAFVGRFRNRLVNVHPSLLPSFPGLDTHRRALEAGVKLHGATVHFVIPELDAGPIIAQAAVPVTGLDTPESLMHRVQAAEHLLYPTAIRWLVSDRVSVDGDRTRFDADAAEPNALPGMMFPETRIV